MATRRAPAKPTPEAASPAAAPAAPVADRPRLTDAQLGDLMRLIKGADSVELKLTVAAEQQRATVQGLPVDPVEAQPRQVFFFDTPDLALNAAGIVVRARRIQGGRGDTVIKLRPVEPDQLPADIRKQADFNVEVDALPGGFVCSASYKGRSTGQEIRDAVAGKFPLRRLFSKTQRAFYKEHAPEGLDLDSLVVLGPTFLLKTRFPIKSGLNSRAPERLLVGEMWLYPDGTRILELSTKCLPAEAFSVAMEVRGYLAGRGIDLGGVQQTKTKTALEYYAAQLAPRRGPDPRQGRCRVGRTAGLRPGDDGAGGGARRRAVTRAGAAGATGGNVRVRRFVVEIVVDMSSWS